MKKYSFKIFQEILGQQPKIFINDSYKYDSKKEAFSHAKKELFRIASHDMPFACVRLELEDRFLELEKINKKNNFSSKKFDEFMGDANNFDKLRITSNDFDLTHHEMRLGDSRYSYDNKCYFLRVYSKTIKSIELKKRFS